MTAVLCFVQLGGGYEMIVFIRVDSVRVTSCINLNLRLGATSFNYSQKRREDEHSTATEKYGRG